MARRAARRTSRLAPQMARVVATRPLRTKSNTAQRRRGNAISTDRSGKPTCSAAIVSPRFIGFL